MKSIFTPVLALAATFLTLGSPARAAAPAVPASGSVKMAAYTVCRALGKVDLGAVGSNSSADCAGIVKNIGDGKTLDNLSLRCLEESKARTDGYGFTGTCVESDADGDKIYLSYEGAESGPLHWLGGSGKYKDTSGEGTWSVADAPGNNANLFAFTLSYEVSWKTK